MKFRRRSTSLRRNDARNYFAEWRRWFAWYPVRVGPNEVRWLEFVERSARSVHEGIFFEWVPTDPQYRSIDKASK